MDHDRHPPDASGGLHLDDLEADGYKPPARWKGVIPWIITTAILAWVFYGFDFHSFVLSFQQADLVLVVGSFLLFTLVYALGDVASYGPSYRWFAAPDLTARQVVKVRLGAFLFHAFYTPLSTALNLIYLRRVKGTPVWWALSAAAITSVIDLFSVNVLITAALLVNLRLNLAPSLENRWFYLAAGPWIIALAYVLYWFTPIRDVNALQWLTRNPILRSCRFGRPRQLLTIMAVRLLMVLAGVAAHYAALRGFNIDVPLPLVMVVAPLMIGVSFMPISGGGFGGPQLVALILLPYANGSQPLVTAYSVAFSASFTLGRSALSTALLPFLLRDLRTSTPKITVDPLTGQDLG